MMNCRVKEEASACVYSTRASLKKPLTYNNDNCCFVIQSMEPVRRFGWFDVSSKDVVTGDTAERIIPI